MDGQLDGLTEHMSLYTISEHCYVLFGYIELVILSYMSLRLINRIFTSCMGFGKAGWLKTSQKSSSVRIWIPKGDCPYQRRLERVQ
jgi:hypothetical protein